MSQRARRKVNRNASRHVTPAAVAAFKAGDGFALTAALKLPPWYPSPLDVDTDEGPEVSTPYAEAWAEVRQIRLALEAASG